MPSAAMPSATMPSATMKASGAAAICVLALFLTCSSGCAGGEQTVAPKTWAKSFCGDITTWLGRIRTRSATLEKASAGVTSLSAARRLLVDFLDDAIGYTDTLLQRLHDTGTPKVTDGKALAVDFRSGVGQAKAIFERGRQRARAVPVTNRDAFTTAATALGKDISSAGAKVGTTFADISKKHKVPELDRAFAAEPSCKQLRSTG